MIAPILGDVQVRAAQYAFSAMVKRRGSSSCHSAIACCSVTKLSRWRYVGFRM